MSETELVVGGKATTTKYPGVWEVVEHDDFMVRLRKEQFGVVHVARSSVTPFVAKEAHALSSNELNMLAAALVRRLASFASPAIGDKMQQLEFTEERLYRDLLAETIAHVTAAGVDIVDILADAMNLIGAENGHSGLYDAAERVKNR